MTLHWWADDGPLLVLFGSSLPSLKKSIGPPLAKFSGSVHVIDIDTILFGCHVLSRRHIDVDMMLFRCHVTPGSGGKSVFCVMLSQKLNKNPYLIEKDNWERKIKC